MTSLDHVRRTPAPAVSVVIPTLRCSPHVGALVASIASTTHIDHEIVVSHSGDDPPPAGLAATVLRSEAPLLASAARNAGAAVARGRYLLFIDDDNEPAAGLVDSLLGAMEDDPTIAVIGPATYYAGDRERPWSLGAHHGGLLHRTVWARPSAADRATGLLACDALPNAFMVRRSDFEAVGGFDEAAFPMHFEESDLQMRVAARAGGRVVCHLRSRDWHHAPLPRRDRLGCKSLERYYLSGRNRQVFIGRHWGLRHWAFNASVGHIPSSAAVVWGCLCGTNATGCPRTELLAAFIRGWLDGLVAGAREGRRQRRVTAGCSPHGAPA